MERLSGGSPSPCFPSGCPSLQQDAPEPGKQAGHPGVWRIRIRKDREHQAHGAALNGHVPGGLRGPSREDYQGKRTMTVYKIQMKSLSGDKKITRSEENCKLNMIFLYRR